MKNRNYTKNIYRLTQILTKKGTIYHNNIYTIQTRSNMYEPQFCQNSAHVYVNEGQLGSVRAYLFTFTVYIILYNIISAQIKLRIKISSHRTVFRQSEIKTLNH